MIEIDRERNTEREREKGRLEDIVDAAVDVLVRPPHRKRRQQRVKHPRLAVCVCVCVCERESE